MAHVIVSGVDTGRCIPFITIDAHILFRHGISPAYEQRKCEALYDELTELIKKYFPAEGDGEILSDRQFYMIGNADLWEREHYCTTLREYHDNKYL